MSDLLSCAACNKQESDALKLRYCGRCKNETYCGVDCQTKHWSEHKAYCKRPNYILKFHLCPDTITNSSIWRTLSCPAAATFQKLHEALQIAFGYASTHTYDFRIKDLQAERQDEEDAASGDGMMDMMKQLMSASGKPLDESYLGTRSLLRIVDPNTRAYIDNMHSMHRRHKDTPEKKADRLKLYQVLDDSSYSSAPMQYEYDFGDCWEHHITRVARADEATGFFQCIAGEGHGVAEDVGSTKGWENLKQAYRSQRPKKDQREQMEWFEKVASNKDHHGLNNGGDRMWPKTEINARLAEG